MPDSPGRRIALPATGGPKSLGIWDAEIRGLGSDQRDWGQIIFSALVDAVAAGGATGAGGGCRRQRADGVPTLSEWSLALLGLLVAGRRRGDAAASRLKSCGQPVGLVGESGGLIEPLALPIDRPTTPFQ